MICTVSVYLKFNCTYYYLPCMEICMFLLQALIDIQMSLIFNESIVIYRVIKCTKKKSNILEQLSPQSSAMS